MDYFLRLSRRLNWIIWLGSITLAPIVGLAICIWLGTKLWGIPFPGGDDIKIVVVIIGFVIGMVPYIFNLMAYGLTAPENHQQTLNFYRQMERGLIKLMVIGLVFRELLPDQSEIILGIITAIFLLVVSIDTFRTVSVASYIWRNAKSEAALRQYLTDHYFTFFRM